MDSVSDNDRLFSLRSHSYAHILDNSDARRKAQLFSALVPAGCRSILDVGGASGWATLALRDRCRVITLDRSLPSLLAGGTDAKAAADAGRLPFGDRSFDMVMSSQVLEHLPEAVFKQARAEMARTATKFLMVSVPYREDLAARMVRCPHCGHAFHTDHHLRAFQEQDLAGLFAGWTLAEWHVFGVLNQASGLGRLGPGVPRRRLPVAGALTVCPQCTRPGSPAGPAGPPSSEAAGSLWAGAKRQAFRMLTGLLQPTFLPQAEAPYWIAGLYIPQGSASAIDSDIAGQPGGKASQE